jgi:hypothetical protein
MGGAAARARILSRAPPLNSPIPFHHLFRCVCERSVFGPARSAVSVAGSLLKAALSMSRIAASTEAGRQEVASLRDILRLGVSGAALSHHLARRSRGLFSGRNRDPIGAKVEIISWHDAPYGSVNVADSYFVAFTCEKAPPAVGTFERGLLGAETMGAC